LGEADGGADMKRETDANDAIDFIYLNAPDYAKAKATRVYLEEFRKSKKALLMQESKESSAVAQEKDAYAHSDYLELLAGIREAVEIEESLRWQMVAAQLRVDVWRSEESSARFVQKAVT
jgi:hypothetical protein